MKFLLKKTAVGLAVVVLVVITGVTIPTWGPKTKLLVIAVCFLAAVGLVLAALLLNRIMKDEDRK